MSDVRLIRRISIEELTDLQARALPRIRDHLDRSPLDPLDDLPVTSQSERKPGRKSGVIVT